MNSELRIVALLLLALGSTGCETTPVRTFEYLSPVYTVDREYRSMKGPSSTQALRLPEFDSRELVWITGYRAEMVAADGRTPVSQEYMCHSNLDFDQQRHAKLFDEPVYHFGRLFTLSQGQFEIELPEGFGLPYYADEEFDVTTQVLNLNPDGQTRNVRHRVTIEYVRDRDLKRPMTPLFMTSGWGLKLLEGDGGHYGVSPASEGEHGESCLPGEVAGHDQYTDEFGRLFTGHWVVKPGREVNHTLVTNILDLPYDTRVHYAAVHLHPFAESLELVDLTTGETVFRSDVDNSEGKIGLDRVDYFSSAEGVPVHADHEYQLISTYDNTTDRDQDSMAVMLLYPEDKLFRRSAARPEEVPLTHVAGEATWADERIRLHTSLGDVTIGLYDAAAPGHFEQMLELARLGVFDTMQFSRIEDFLVQTNWPGLQPGKRLTPAQRAGVRRMQAELTDLPFERGTVAMVLESDREPHSAVGAFFILLRRAPWLDGRYTIVGKVIDGLDVIDAMARVPRNGKRPVEPIEIQNAEVVVGASGEGSEG